MERRRRAGQGFSGKGDVRLIAQWKAGSDKSIFIFIFKHLEPSNQGCLCRHLSQ